jgi:hypothetical protein
MRTITIKTFLGLIIIFSILALSTANAERPKNTSDNKLQSLLKPTGAPLNAMLNINNFTTWYRADGESSDPSSGALDGGVFPRGTKWVIYQDGIVWGGKAYLDAAHTQQAPLQLIRIGGQTYNVGTVRGRIAGMDSLAVAVSPADADVRIYRIRRDYKALSADELKLDAAGVNEILVGDVTTAQMEAVTSQYHTDWSAWPVQYGAPYIERNGTPGYQNPPAFNYDKASGPLFTVDSLIAGSYDEPGLAGSDPNSPADQVIWTVYNDLNETATLGLYGSYPIGLEVQATLWGYKRTDAMGNLYFKKIKIINKGGVDVGGGTKGSFYIDSMYIAQWSDPDLGAFGDDLSGCDSVLSLGFIYNGNAIDAEFTKFKLPPPAAGYDFLQGPLVAGAPSDTGIFDLKKVGGKINLGMSSFAYFAAGSAISDPLFTYDGGLRWWKMLRGFVPDDPISPEKLYDHPPGYPISKFPLSGDPVARKGFLDGLGENYSFAPGDRRIVLNTGPFTLAPADTQEIVVGTVGGMGADRLSSIAVMKFNDRFVQNTYDALFQVPKAPDAPSVTYAELNREIILEWGSNLPSVTKIETEVKEPGAYKFEGYNVYQLPSSSSGLSQAVRITTYDLATDPTVVLDEQFEPNSGQILNLPVQFGSNSGITRNIQIKRDYVLDVDQLSNGQEYYFAVTAYSVATQPGYLPKSLESVVNVMTVRPKYPQVGTRYHSSYDEMIEPTHVTGIADAKIDFRIIDPTKITGDTYEIRLAAPDSIEVVFEGDTLKFPNIQWSLYNATKDVVSIPLSNNYVIDPANKILDGFRLGFSASPYWIPGEEISSQKYLPSTNLNWEGVDWGGSTFDGGLDVGYNFFGSTLLPYEVKKTVEVRFNPAQGQNAYDYLRTTSSGGAAYIGFFPQPFTVWDVTDPTNERQIDFLFMEQSGRTTYDSIWAPGEASGAREYFFFVDETYTSTEKSEYVGTNANWAGANKPVLYSGWYVLTDAGKPAYNDGDVWRITATKVLTLEDLWRFDTKNYKSTFSADLQKSDAKNNIKVFPNPYYAFNSAEIQTTQKFVTFNNLPPRAIFRIFNLAGQLVFKEEKNDPSQFFRWNLVNNDRFPVASGMYIVYIDMPDIGTTKTLKVAIIQEQEVPGVF